MIPRKFIHKPFAQPAPDDPIEAIPGLAPEENALARDLRSLAGTIQPDPSYVAYLEGQLRRKRLPTRPTSRRQTLASQARLVLKTTWNWALPAASLILLTIAISLLVQMRPQPIQPALAETATQPATIAPSASFEAQSLALTLADLGAGWQLDAEKADLNDSYYWDWDENGNAIIATHTSTHNPPFDPALLDSVVMRGFSQHAQGGLLFNTVFVFKDTAQAEAFFQQVLEGGDGDTSLPREFTSSDGEVYAYEAASIGEQAIQAQMRISPEAEEPVATMLYFRQGRVLVSLDSIGKPGAETFGPPLDPAQVAALAQVVAARIPEATPIPATDTPPTPTLEPTLAPTPTLEPTPTPTAAASSFEALDLALSAADLGQGWTLDAEKADLQAEYFLNRSADGKALIWREPQGYSFPLEPAQLASVSLRGFSQAEQHLVLFQVIARFHDEAQAEAVMQAFLPDCELPCESVSTYEDGSGDRSTYRDPGIGEQSMVGSGGDTLEAYFPFLTFLHFRQGQVITILFSIGDFLDLDSGPPVPEATLEALAKIVAARLAAADTPASADDMNAAEGDETPPTPTPAYADQPLLAKLQTLIERRQTELLASPGWIYQHTWRYEAAACGYILPNGASTPCEIEALTWYEVNAQGQIITTITRQLGPSGNLFQESVTHNGMTRNLTFGYEQPADPPLPFAVDMGFLADAAQALERGAALRQEADAMGADFENAFILHVEEGATLREAVFNEQTGGLLGLSTWIEQADPLGGTSQGQSVSVKVLEERWMEQPPAEALALLERPTPPYQPLPPEGEPVPAGFVLAHSKLGFKSFAGDAFLDPSFWYGDIYADGSYLLGRLDFGAVQGGFCQRSPDGTKLAFDHVTLSDEAPAVHQLRWLVLSDLKDVHAPLPEVQLVSPPVWGPDSARLAFTACDTSLDCGFYTYDTLSGALVRLAAGGNAVPPVWSPDGSQTAYQVGEGEAPQTVIVDAASGEVIADPAWQPQFAADWSGYSQCSLPPALAPTLPEPPADWLVYTNPAYGFTFRYPAGWTLSEQPHAVKLTQGELTFSIYYRRSEEARQIWRTGVPAGDITHGGHISFFGLALARRPLVYEGEVKAVLYSIGREIARGELLFILSLDHFGPDYGAVDISAALQEEVDRMVESFEGVGR